MRDYLFCCLQNFGWQHFHSAAKLVQFGELALSLQFLLDAFSGCGRKLLFQFRIFLGQLFVRLVVLFQLCPHDLHAGDILVQQGFQFFCLGLFVERVTRDEYLQCLDLLWRELENHYSEKDVCVPILGAGTTSFDGGSGASISQQDLLNMMIWSYKLSSHKIKAPHKLRIVCKKNSGFSINNIDK